MPTDDRYDAKKLHEIAADLRKGLGRLQKELDYLEMRRASRRALASLQEVAQETFKLGVWLDDPPSLVLQPNYLGLLTDLGVDHLVVMVDGPEPGLDDARWDVGQLQRLRTMLPAQIDLVPSIWPIPSRHFIENVLPNRLPAILQACHTSRLELDCEPAGDWTKGDLDGYQTLEQCSHALWGVLRRAGVEFLDVTTFPAAVRHCAALLDASKGRLVLQTYAVTTRQGEDVGFESNLGPEKWTERGYQIARRSTDAPVALGIAAYRSKFPNRTEAHAWRTQLRVFRELEGVERVVRVWSSKWLCRKKGHARRRAELVKTLRP